MAYCFELLRGCVEIEGARHQGGSKNEAEISGDSDPRARMWGLELRSADQENLAERVSKFFNELEYFATAAK